MYRSGAIARPTVRYRLVETFVYGSHGQVMVQELRKLHYHERVPRMQITDVWMDYCRHDSWRGQKLTGYAFRTWLIDT